MPKQSLSERTYEKYADMLYRLALSHLQNSHDAQDAVHDVFIKLIRTCPSFTNEEHELAWFVRVTINRCHDISRRRKLRRYIPIDELTEQPQESGDMELAIDVVRSLAKLPEKYKTVIVLHYLEGYTVAEVAEILQLSESAVKMRLSRGRKMYEINEKEVVGNV